MTDRRGGYVLLAVLGIVVAIAAAALGVSVELRDRRLAVRNLSDSQRSRATALSAIAQAQSQLTTRLRRDTRADPWSEVNNETWADSTEGIRWVLHLRDDESCVNVNTSTAAQLARLFQALGVHAPDALAEAIANYRATGGELRELPELSNISGIDSALFARVAPYLTVHGSGRTNLKAAPTAVLASLPGFDDVIVDAIEDERKAGRLPGLLAIMARLPQRQQHSLGSMIPQLEGMITFETRHVSADVVAQVQGAVIREQVVASFVRELRLARLTELRWQ